jgi:hypothetical protein
LRKRSWGINEWCWKGDNSSNISLKKHAEDFAIIDIFELNNADGTAYYASLESASSGHLRA